MFEVITRAAYPKMSAGYQESQNKTQNTAAYQKCQDRMENKSAGHRDCLARTHDSRLSEISERNSMSSKWPRWRTCQQVIGNIRTEQHVIEMAKMENMSAAHGNCLK
jgi:hypothetical protein